MDTANATDTTLNTTDEAQQALPMSEALAASKGHLGTGNEGEQAGDKQVEGGGAAAPAKPAPRKRADKPQQSAATQERAASKSSKPAKGKTTGAKDKAIAQDGTAGKADGGVEEVRMGKANVLITEMAIISRGGLNTQREEDYPFAAMGFSQQLQDGSVSGPSFFIPKSDNPTQRVATARKRHRSTTIQFITRKVTEVVPGEEAEGKQDGTRVWKIDSDEIEMK